jgi:hypothetical protein
VTAPDVQQAVDAAFREEWRRVVATLIRRTGDWDLAEECAQEAFTEALRRFITLRHSGVSATGRSIARRRRQWRPEPDASAFAYDIVGLGSRGTTSEAVCWLGTEASVGQVRR